MRPNLRFLTDQLIERIIGEARLLLCNLGVDIHNDRVMSMLSDNGAQIDTSKKRARMTHDIIDRALKSVSKSFKLYDTNGELSADMSADNIHFTPGSTAINILDSQSGATRHPTTRDYIRYAKLMRHMSYIANQSTAMIASDVHDKIADSYRLYLSLLYCEKPVITGAFTIESFEIMKDLQLAVRGSREALAAKPLTVFSACPTSPLKWSDVTSQNVVDCALYSIPVEFVAMPLAGFIAPVTLVGSLIQHTAETISGIVISQLTSPGAPILYGGSPAVFDIRYETTPMGDIGTMMMDCAYSEIGKHLGLPTQAYIGLSDAKQLDAQAGMETSMGATLAALSGVNSISGPGMLDFESCFSLEKLVLDNEICGMTFRMIQGIEPRDDFPSQPLFEELLKEEHLLIADHTRRHLKSEVLFPGPVIDRANRSRWQEEGGHTLAQRALHEVERLLAEDKPPVLPDEMQQQLTDRMLAEARKFGQDRLPPLN